MFLCMTTLMDIAVETVRRLPPGTQDEIARAMLQFAAREEACGPDELPSMLDERAKKLAADCDAALRRFGQSS